MPRRSSTAIGLCKRILFYLGLIITWEGVYRTGFFPAQVFPSPWAVVHTLFTGFSEGTFAGAMAISMKRIFSGYLAALPIGFLLGLLVGRYRFLDQAVSPILLGLQSLPNVCWVPLALFWFGYSEETILFAIIIGSVFSLALSVVSGIRNIPPIYLNLAKTLGAKGFAYDTTVLIPAALPSIVAGMRQSWSFAWRGLISGELLSPQNGLGFLLNAGKNASDMNYMVAVILIIIFLGVLVDYIMFSKLEKSIRYRWGLLGN